MLNPPKCQKICTTTGPLPHSIGMVYKDKSKPISDTRVRLFGPDLDPRAENEVYRLKIAKENKESKYKRDWATSLQKKIVGHEARREFSHLQNSYQEQLEDRKFRLYKLLEEEEDELIKEMESVSKRKPLAYNELVEKITCFKKEREERRLELVKSKMELKFVKDCPEIRPKLSAQLAEAVLSDRREQVREHENVKRMKQLEDEYYNCLWHADYLQKLHREEVDALERHAKNMETLIVLNKQMTAKQLYKQRVDELAKEDAKLLAEEQIQLELEKKKDLEEKQRKKIELRQSLQEDIALAQAKKMEEKLQDQEFDSFYTNFLGPSGSGHKLTKLEILKEAQDNLKQVLCDKADRLAKERESERLIKLDNDMQWDKYMETKDKAEEKRRKLLEETLTIRKKQVENKIAENEKRQIEMKQEVETIRQMIEFNRKMAEEDEERHRKAVIQYRETILKQIEEHKQEQKIKEEQMKEECDNYLKLEAEYQNKLDETVKKFAIGNLHPMRALALHESEKEPKPETDTSIHMKMRISQLEEIVNNKKNQLSDKQKTTQVTQKMEQFNNILSYYNPED